MSAMVGMDADWGEVQRSERDDSITLKIAMPKGSIKEKMKAIKNFVGIMQVMQKLTGEAIDMKPLLDKLEELELLNQLDVKEDV